MVTTKHTAYVVAIVMTEAKVIKEVHCPYNVTVDNDGYIVGLECFVPVLDERYLILSFKTLLYNDAWYEFYDWFAQKGINTEGASTIFTRYLSATESLFVNYPSFGTVYALLDIDRGIFRNGTEKFYLFEPIKPPVEPEQPEPENPENPDIDYSKLDLYFYALRNGVPYTGSWDLSNDGGTIQFMLQAYQGVTPVEVPQDFVLNEPHTVPNWGAVWENPVTMKWTKVTDGEYGYTQINILHTPSGNVYPYTIEWQD